MSYLNEIEIDMLLISSRIKREATPPEFLSSCSLRIHLVLVGKLSPSPPLLLSLPMLTMSFQQPPTFLFPNESLFAFAPKLILIFTITSI